MTWHVFRDDPGYLAERAVEAITWLAGRGADVNADVHRGTS